MDESVRYTRYEYFGSNDRLNEISYKEANPFRLFEEWYNLAKDCIKEPNAMSLATANPNGKPSLRMVLMRGFSDDGVIFYTNYKSRKGNDLKMNDSAALLFFWPSLHRQIRIEGVVAKTSINDSNEYFQSRPRINQIDAIISPQSESISLNELKERREVYKDQLILKKPDYWGGYCLKPKNFEFWQGQGSRLHDRFSYCLNESNDSWNFSRLAP
ncbi:hypothetical protein A3Q56_04417 [Intoshia linei]|uniref:pyridoxal 5'-phosphate synthase n=1 Tax=Intoshia linei TaxID=1819745 RepID=A0A177B2L6_9BILA|nr:hypothetical protein A3Q56_04417 [Intoshia linei]